MKRREDTVSNSSKDPERRGSLNIAPNAIPEKKNSLRSDENDDKDAAKDKYEDYAKCSLITNRGAPFSSKEGREFPNSAPNSFPANRGAPVQRFLQHVQKVADRKQGGVIPSRSPQAASRAEDDAAAIEQLGIGSPRAPEGQGPKHVTLKFLIRYV